MPHANLASPGALDAVFSARSFRGEIIVSCFKDDPFSLRWMLHYARMAQSKGFDHFVPIGWRGSCCDAFRREWCASFGCGGGSEALYPGCAYLDADAVDGGHPRWRDAMRVDAIVYMWMARRATPSYDT